MRLRLILFNAIHWVDRTLSVGFDAYMDRRCVYAASFDPITNGHLWVIEQGERLFDELIVAIGSNPDKQYEFSLDERVDLVKASLAGHGKATVDTYENRFLVEYARSRGAEFVLRGIRTELDYQYERSMKYINSDLDADVVTIFLMPPREIAEVSSSVVKSLVGFNGWETVLEKYVPPPVHAAFVKRFSEVGTPLPP